MVTYLSYLIVGILLLLLGRKLFWLFVGSVGFVAGFMYAEQLLGMKSEIAIFGASLGLGIIGALLAMFLQTLAVAVAGFIAGGHVVLSVMEVLGRETAPSIWLPYVIGGIVGAVLTLVVFDWALILLSSLTGASLLVEISVFPPGATIPLSLVLFILGFAFQTKLLLRERSETPKD